MDYAWYNPTSKEVPLYAKCDKEGKVQTFKGLQKIVIPEGYELMPLEQWEPLYEAWIGGFITDPQEISAQRWDDMFEILPPCKWHGAGGSVQFFHSPERLIDEVVLWFVKLDDKYYQFYDRDNINPVTKCREKVKVS